LRRRMSAFGPQRTSASALHMSAIGSKADMTGCRCPLSWSLLGVKRTWPIAAHMSAFDPKRTWAGSKSRTAAKPSLDPRQSVMLPRWLARTHMQFDGLKRREFITLLGVATAWPLAARAQQRDRLRRVAVVMQYVESDAQGQLRAVAFREGLEKA